MSVSILFIFMNIYILSWKRKIVNSFVLPYILLIFSVLTININKNVKYDNLLKENIYLNKIINIFFNLHSKTYTSININENRFNFRLSSSSDIDIIVYIFYMSIIYNLKNVSLFLSIRLCAISISSGLLI